MPHPDVRGEVSRPGDSGPRAIAPALPAEFCGLGLTGWCTNTCGDVIALDLLVPLMPVLVLSAYVVVPLLDLGLQRRASPEALALGLILDGYLRHALVVHLLSTLLARGVPAFASTCA